jgi:hypothetical protein
MRRVGLFLALTSSAAVAAPSGAFAFGSLANSDLAFFGGGFAVGALAVLLVGWLLVWGRIVPRQRYRAVCIGAVVGLASAVGVSAFTVLLVIIPLLSFAFVGAGAVIGDVEAAHGERQASSERVA